MELRGSITTRHYAFHSLDLIRREIRSLHWRSAKLTALLLAVNLALLPWGWDAAKQMWMMFKP